MNTFVETCVRWAIRRVRRHPVEAFLQILILTVSFAPIFALAWTTQATLYRHWPYRAPGQLVTLTLSTDSEPGSPNVTYGTLRELAESGLFAGVVAMQPGTTSGRPDFDYAADDGMERLSGARVSPDVLDVLGGTVARGRSFGAATDSSAAAGDPGALVSFSFWKRRLGGSASTVGTPI